MADEWSSNLHVLRNRRLLDLLPTRARGVLGDASRRAVVGLLRRSAPLSPTSAS